MKFLPVIFLSAVLLYSCAPVQVPPTISSEEEILSAKNWTVAVLDLNYVLEESGSVSVTNYKTAGPDGGKVVAGLLAASLAEIPQITIVERAAIAKVFDELSLQQSGMIDSGTAKEIGRLTGADAVVVGDLTDYLIWDALGSFGSTISFSVRMIDVSDGRVLFNASISRARPLVDSFANVQLTTREIVDTIFKN
jgi:curli biogenesis system outer membrane secretion channel CsgG